MRLSLSLPTGIILASWLTLASSIGAQPSSSSAQAPKAEETEAAPPETPPPGWFFNVDGGYVYQLNTSLDEGGDFTVHRFAVRGGLGYQPDAMKRLGVGLGYDRNHYSFGGNTGFGGADPWDDINTVRLGFPIGWGFNERWTLFVLPAIRLTAEDGADWSESVSGGGFIGFSYRFSDKLTLGPGVGALTEIEDSPTYFPVLLIRWNLVDKWWIATDEGLGASQGPGLSLTYAATDEWSAFVGGRYEKFRFRLSENGANPNGVGEDSGVPIYFGATYRWHRERSVSLIGGVKLGGEMTLENSSGHKIADSDFDPAPFVGFSCDLKF